MDFVVGKENLALETGIEFPRDSKKEKALAEGYPMKFSRKTSSPRMPGCVWVEVIVARLLIVAVTWLVPNLSDGKSERSGGAGGRAGDSLPGQHR